MISLSIIVTLYPEFRLSGWLYLGLWLALVTAARMLVRSGKARTYLGLFVLEELVAVSLIGFFPFSPSWCKRAAGCGLAAAVLLLTRRRVPDRILPLRGRWLRWFLATVVVAALLSAATPGLQLFVSRLPRSVGWALAAMLLWLGKPVLDMLAAPDWPARFTAWDEINRL